MIALADLGLFVLDPAVWVSERESFGAPIQALMLHIDFLRRCPVDLLWSDAFFNAFPWNQPSCPRELRDVCVIVTRMHEHLRGNGRLLLADELLPVPAVAPAVEPELLVDMDYPEDIREAWLGLLGAVMPEDDLWAGGMALLTWERALLAGVRELRVTLGAAPSVVRSAALLTGDVDWRAFLERFHRPDLRGKRVAVLGGHRPPFERARERLSSYGLTDLRRIAPVSEKNRTRQDLRQALLHVDLLVVCTNYMGHTDTDQLDGIEEELSCASVRLHADSDAQISRTIIDYFRSLPEPA
jgi:hypothetical protein